MRERNFPPTSYPPIPSYASKPRSTLARPFLTETLNTQPAKMLVSNPKTNATSMSRAPLPLHATTPHPAHRPLRPHRPRLQISVLSLRVRSAMQRNRALSNELRRKTSVPQKIAISSPLPSRGGRAWRRYPPLPMQRSSILRRRAGLESGFQRRKRTLRWRR